MKKKILGVLVALLAVALLTVPVMSAPATKIEGVTLTAVVTNTPGSLLISDHTILHTRGTSIGTVTLTISGQDLPGTWYSEWISRNKWSNYPDPDPDPEAEVLIQSKVVLTFLGKGTFEGTTYRKIIGWSTTPPPPISYIYTRGVLHGTGNFRGQTLKIEDNTAYLIIPK